MRCLRVYITGWTASFRYPTFISGSQPTFPIPPISTIYGLISAAKGDLITPNQVSIGYVFESAGRGEDLEKIYELEQKGRKAKTNIVRREFLYEPQLYLYISDISYKKFFEKPHYPLVLGRSSDLVKVEGITTLKLDKTTETRLGKTILPLGTEGAYGTFHSLPTHFTNEIPRKAKGIKPYILMKEFFRYEKECLADPDKQWGVWFHGKNN